MVSSLNSVEELLTSAFFLPYAPSSRVMTTICRPSRPEGTLTVTDPRVLPESAVQLKISASCPPTVTMPASPRNHPSSVSFPLSSEVSWITGSGLVSALAAFSLPLLQQISEYWSSFTVPPMTRAEIFDAVSSGWLAQSSPYTPVVIGVAIDVPP